MTDSKRSKPYAVRFPIELSEVIEARALADGITAGEVIRNVLYAWAYGVAPGADEGYYIARGNGARIAHWLIAQAFSSLPASEEEAQEIIAQIPPLGGSFAQRR